MTRFALCIGINNYPGTDMDLQGCVNDAADWAAEFNARGFSSVRTLLNEQATKAAMLQAMREVIASGASGDLVAITFSGHGTYVFDTDDNEEPDGFDEALCPHDVQATGDPLTDDEIHALFAARPPGVRLLLLADSCHSGTVSRAAVAGNVGDVRKRFLPPGNWMKSAQLARSPLAEPGRGFARAGASALGGTAGADAPALAAGAAAATAEPLDDVLLSGCDEGKTSFSYDAVIADRANGAFTFYALKALRELPDGATYDQWHAAICEHLPTTRFPQAPKLVAIAPARTRRVLD